MGRGGHLINNVIGKIGKIKTPGQQKGNTNYGMPIW